LDEKIKNYKFQIAYSICVLLSSSLFNMFFLDYNFLDLLDGYN
jgi:hypothetical protein